MKKSVTISLTVLVAIMVTYFYIRSDKAAKVAGDLQRASTAIVLTETTTKNKPEKQTKTEVLADSPDEKISKAIASMDKKKRNPDAQIQIVPQRVENNYLFSNTKWKLWSTARAMLAEQTASADVIIQKMGRYNIIETDHAEIDFKSFDKSNLAVVYDPRLRRVGLVTGTIKIVTLQKEELAKALIGMQAEITNSFDDINTYYISSTKNLFDLENLYFSLKAQSFVQNIELDISERTYEKKYHQKSNQNLFWGSIACRLRIK